MEEHTLKTPLKRFGLFVVFLSILSGCQVAQTSRKPSPDATATPEISARTSATAKILEISTQALSTATPETDPTASPPCFLLPVAVPTAPAETPGFSQLDPATGLHVTGSAQTLDLERYRLEVMGKVKHPLKLSYDDLRCLPRIEARPTLVCPEFFADTATWAGAPLKHVLELAGVQAEATRVRLISADGYPASVSMDEALSEQNFLAYEWEGEPLPILHGFPIRAIFPTLEGDVWVKWLVKIEVY